MSPQKIVFFVLLLLAPLKTLGAESAAVVGAAAPDLQVKTSRAEKLAAEGKLFEARKIYEEIFKNSDLLDPQMRTVRDQYEVLNRKILFSTLKEKGTILHEVKPGDSLYRLALKHKTTVALIKKSNGLKSDIIHPGMKLKITTVPFTALVNKTDNVLYLFFGDRPIKTYRVATGTDNSTPVGKFKIVNKLENPTWYYAGAVVPPESPENILGTRWLGFDHQGYGIHGTTMPESIGKQESAGCIRMLNEQVEELYDLIPVGTVVTVVD